MDLMTNSTTYAALEKKYRAFAAPTMRVRVEGIDLAERFGAALRGLTVELTSEYAASGCGFDLVGEYQPAQTDFDTRGAAGLLELGTKVEVELGYIATELVFSGLVTELVYRFGIDGEAPYIHVECMDAKCLLMKTQRLEICREETADRAVGALLREQPVGGYLRGRQVEPAAGVPPLPLRMESDYDFIVRQAQYAGYEFFIVAGKAYFRRTPAAGQPILEVSPDTGLLSAELSLRGERLVKKVSVVGVDPATDREVSGQAAAGGSFGKGAAPGRMLAGTQRIYLDPRAQSAAQAQSRAKVILQELQGQFGVLSGACVGLPELVPGRLVRVTGLSGRSKGLFYLTNVKHQMSSDGFVTHFEARVNSL